VAPDTPTRPARAFVAVFLGVFILCGIARIEAWPFSSFRLFSTVRHEREVGWRYTVLTPAGGRAMPWRELGPAYEGWVQMAGRFHRLSDERRLQVCRAYLQGARSYHRSVTALRISRVERVLSHRVEDRSEDPTVTPVFECDDETVRVLS